MTSRHLILTAEELTWPSQGPILFLGDWCKLYNNKSHWEKLDSLTVPYHWDDRSRFYRDCEYLCKVIDRLIVELTDYFNHYHKVDYSEKFWRILIGPWLMFYIPILYDHWLSIEEAINSYEISEVNGLEFDEGYRPMDLEDLAANAKTEGWNHQIYTEILKFKNFEKLNIKKNLKENVDQPSSNKLDIKRKTIFFLSNLLAVFAKENKYFFKKTYLKPKDEIKLLLKLKQFPVLYIDNPRINFAYKTNIHQLPDFSFESENEFEGFLEKYIFKQIPFAYVEGFDHLQEVVDKKKWPQKTKKIWTSTSCFTDEAFKLWTAKKVEGGASLFIGQHGGHYGQAYFSFPEWHERKISDTYLTWGWDDGNKVAPIGNFKSNVKSKVDKDHAKKLLLVISGASRYVGGIYSMPIAGQWVKYFNDQVNFCKNLTDSVSSQTTIRLYHFDYNWYQGLRFKDSLPGIEISHASKSYNTELLTTKVLVSGWNSTTYLESLAADIPTVIFWDVELFELRERVEEDFEDLRRVGIFHTTPESAAEHINQIWDDVESWWEGDDLKEAKDRFMSKYVNSESLLDKLVSYFEN